MKNAKNENHSSLFKSALMLGALCCVALSQPAFATQPGGLDTPAGVLTLPLAVAGTAVMTLYAPSPAYPNGYVGFAGPIVESATTIQTDGTTVIGGTSATPLTVNGNASITGTASIAGALTVNGRTSINTDGALEIRDTNGTPRGAFLNDGSMLLGSLDPNTAPIVLNGSANAGGISINNSFAALANGSVFVGGVTMAAPIILNATDGAVFATGGFYTPIGSGSTLVEKKLYPFGGIYTTGSNCDDNACRYPNPLTGNCGCPAGYSPAEFWEYESNSGVYADTNTACSVGGTIHWVKVYQCY